MKRIQCPTIQKTFALPSDLHALLLRDAVERTLQTQRFHSWTDSLRAVLREHYATDAQPTPQPADAKPTSRTQPTKGDK